MSEKYTEFLAVLQSFLGEKARSVTKYINKILHNWLHISAASSNFSVKKPSNI